MEKERKKIVLPEGVRFEDTVFGKLEKRKQEILTQINMTTPDNSLTEKLVEAVKDCFSERGIALHVTTDDLTSAIRSVLGQEWVSVEDRLPTMNLVVLVWVKQDISGLRTLGYFSDGIWYSGVTLITTKFSGQVTHWQPLPTPPTT